MRSKTQHGSAHAVIIVFLVIALLGALGFVFYQNFMMPKPEVHQEQAQVEENKTETARLAFQSTIYEFDHPDDWEVVTERPSPSGVETVITSPSGEVEIKFVISEGGVGGACDTSNTLKVRYYNVGTNAITKLGKEPAYMVEAIKDADGGGYEYGVGLTEEGGETHAAVGDSACTVQFVGLASRLILNGGTVEQPTIMANVLFPKLEDPDTHKLKEMQPLKDALAGNEYQSAVAILESARKK